MRVVNHHGRPAVLVGRDLQPVSELAGTRFGTTFPELFNAWDEFRRWASSSPVAGIEVPDAAHTELGCPSPVPRQIFAIGMNYRDHAAETGGSAPTEPPVFTKFAGSLAGARTRLELPSDDVDWEAELVAVIGRTADRVSEDAAWDHVAGLSVGQDFSERRVQLAGAMPQFSLGKSYPGFGPVGPALVTIDELADPDDLAISCAINGQPVQKGRTGEMIFGVPELIARLSRVLPLHPGDLLFTGTPAGVGLARTPPVFLRPGDEVETEIEGLGVIRSTCVRSASRPHPTEEGSA